MSDTAAPSAPYRVLARKYRPRDFSDLIGQEPMVRTLTNAFEAGRIAQAWMLTGVRGVGKTTTARILARALNYTRDGIDRPHIDLSEPGEHCDAIMEGRHVDVIEMDAASHTGIDDIREIIEQVRYRPVSARYKVYIIDEVHMLSTQAFNGLLKTLEEPPEHVKFIFATTEIRKVPITVLSRCQRFDLRRIETAELALHLKKIAGLESVQTDDRSLAMIARAAEGSVRDSLSILDQAIAHGGGEVTAEAVRAMLGLADRARIIDLFEHVMAGRIAEALDEFRAQYDVGADPAVVLTDLADFTHLVTRLRFVPGAADNDPSLSPDEKERGLAFAKQLPVKVLSRTWQMLLKGIPEAELSSRPVAAAEMVLIRLAHAATLPTLDEALKTLAEMPAELRPEPDRPAAPSPNGGGGGSSAVSHQTVSSGASSSGATAMRLVPAESEPAHVIAPVTAPDPAPEPEQPAVPINSLQDLAELAERHRDPLMKVNIRKCLRLVSVENGRLAVSLTDDAPHSLLGDLSRKLQDWTGRRWIVSLSRDGGGGQTLEEAETLRRDMAVADASRDPEVAALLAAFPGSKIIDVRLADKGGADDIEAQFDASAVPVDPDEADDL
ncbi:DNA polymerase III subunit gamma/tau [Oricola cellulosilytica]|uniref:DNA polymerase III subunit gamma/tau n=1 Tax=Oricola cellulosilytica TaxID=1429082 RepID=A0A4R0PF48_9HYPH|nr:DNA polymerase III subunit gamma/tau [Oricola cellulosilytica]TCD16455.1 DNA polymerase III subunit gamma/tau [Oricola cellulosilytica]